MNKNITHEEALQQVLSYFEEQGIDTSITTFNIELLALWHGITVYQAMVLCCNLEDIETMEELIRGEGIQAWYTFDPWDAAIFNDSYEDIMEQIGLSEEDDD
jgi:hypothetical protein